MAFNTQAGPSSQAFRQAAFEGLANPIGAETSRQDPSGFDVFEWYPHFESCRRYFLDQAQHSGPVQALAAFVNIVLPCQQQLYPVISSSSSSPQSAGPAGGVPLHLRQQPSPFSNSASTGNARAVSLTPYIRRLVATGFDIPGVLHGFFGDDWLRGIGPQHETERRNYLFAAKSTSWLKVKAAYDMSPNESIPFLRPLQAATESEIQSAEQTWSEWLAMQDWMVGPRAPDARSHSPVVKREPRD